MIGQTAPRLARRLAWADADLVEGTEALLWPASSEADGDVEELPDRSEACRAVLSWVRPKVLRFEIESPPRALSELLLVSTLAVGGPAQFVGHKSYQISTTVACEPPRDITIVERRDLFRVPVAARVTIESASGTWDLYSVDCSGGGIRICPPDRGGSRGRGQGRAQRGNEVVLPAVVRHCRPYPPGARMAHQAHLPGERVELEVRLSRQEFTFDASTVSCETTVEDEGKTVRHFVKLSFDDAGAVVEGNFRKAVRELSIERFSSRRT